MPKIPEDNSPAAVERRAVMSSQQKALDMAAAEKAALVVPKPRIAKRP